VPSALAFVHILSYKRGKRARVSCREVRTTSRTYYALLSPLMRTIRSHAIGQKAGQSLYYAFEQAERISLPLTAHVTITFAVTRCDATMILPAFSRLRRNLFNKWATRNGFAPTGAYAFENVRDNVPFTAMESGGDHNVHAHWALHVPPVLRHRFEMNLLGWIETVTGGIVDHASVLRVTYPVAFRLRSYLLKGLNPQWAPIYGAFAKAQGVIVGGRRTGTTANISRSKRIATDRALGIRRRIPPRPRGNDVPRHIAPGAI